MAWSDRQSNYAVNFTDLQTSGFTLKSGQSHVTSTDGVTKAAALAKLDLDASAMSAFQDNWLVPKSSFVATPSVNCGTQYQLTFDSSGWMYDITKDIIVTASSGTVNIDYSFEPYPGNPGSAYIVIQVQYEGGSWTTLLDDYIPILSTVSGTLPYSFTYNTSDILKVRISRADT